MPSCLIFLRARSPGATAALLDASFSTSIGGVVAAEMVLVVDSKLKKCDDNAVDIQFFAFSVKTYEKNSVPNWGNRCT